MLKATPVMLTFLAIAAITVPARAQMGGGGGGGGGGGIPLGALGSHDDDNKEKPDKKSASERPVSGIVTDADGKPIVGAVVHLLNIRTQKIDTLITREKGEYQFTGLSKDVNYQLTAVLKDHSSEPHTLSMYDPRPKPIVNLQIK